MKTILLLLLLLSFLCCQLFAQNDSSFINWSAERKLAWNDFKAQPPNNDSRAAVTNTHLGFSYYFSNAKLTHKVECRFVKTNSWGLVKTDFILQHEQAHFDIAEIFARRLHKAILEYPFNSKSYRNDLDLIYEKIANAESDFQKQYDTETNHSLNKQKQVAWLKKIAAQLEELNSFSNYR